LIAGDISKRRAVPVDSEVLGEGLQLSRMRTIVQVIFNYTVSKGACGRSPSVFQEEVPPY
jgi:hypothetical protein